jgi:hypothetical protein
MSIEERIINMGEYTQFALLQIAAGETFDDAVWNAEALRVRLEGMRS